MSSTSIPVRVRARHRQGRCYELAGKGIMRDGADGWALVHGELQTPNLGPMPHAWLENGEAVYDAVLDAVYPRDYYYTRWQAVEHARYDRRAACVALSDAKFWGPWDTSRATA